MGDTFLFTGSSCPNPFGLGPPGAKQTLCKEERELRRILTEEGAILQEKAMLVGSPTGGNTALKQFAAKAMGRQGNYVREKPQERLTKQCRTGVPGYVADSAA